MKYNLLGAVSTIALGAAFGIGTHGAANAALTCTAGSGSTVGSFACSETVSAGFAVTPTSNIMSLDKWAVSYTHLDVYKRQFISSLLFGNSLYVLAESGPLEKPRS